MSASTIIMTRDTSTTADLLHFPLFRVCSFIILLVDVLVFFMYMYHCIVYLGVLLRLFYDTISGSEW